MRKFRFIQFNTITFENNYVWTELDDISKCNPKSNTDTDVYYLKRIPPSSSDIIIDNGDILC